MEIDQKNDRPMPQKPKVPIGIVVLSILSILGALRNVVKGIILISNDTKFVLAWIAFGFSLLTSILALSIVSGLWKGENWARKFYITGTAIILPIFLLGIFMGRFQLILGFIITFAVLAYLLFNKRVKSFFNQL